MNTIAVPLFLLNTVLFPGGYLPLHVFERRYLDMVSRCLKSDSAFGVCLIREGQEVGTPALPYSVGTLARVTTWDMTRPGILEIVVIGDDRFQIHETMAQDDGLVCAEVEILPRPASAIIPSEHSKLVTMLQRIIDDLGDEYRCSEPDWQNAGWVSCRLAELAPVSHVHKQNLLEISDPDLRLQRLVDLFQAVAKHPA